MTGVAVALAGRIGSGKTSVAVALAQKLGWPRVGFGDYVRSEATRRGLIPASREVLQELGENLLGQDLEGFCRSVLAQADRATDGGLVIDGVRHVAVLDALCRLLQPIPVRLIYLAAGDEVRRLRLTAAGRLHDGTLAEMERHSTEADVASALPASADAVLDADRGVEAVLADALAHVRAGRCPT